jgi:1,4-dihydroxy-2-naphthoate octaprenyltransferase
MNASSLSSASETTLTAPVLDSTAQQPTQPAALSTQREKAIRVIKIALFSASIVPSAVAGAAGNYAGAFDWTTFALLTAGLFIGQLGGDYLYYYSTHFHTDTRDAHTKIFAGWRPFFADSLFKDRRTLIAGILCLVLDAALGLYFVQQAGVVVLWLALAGGLVAIFFTPMMLRGYKEPVIFVTFGPLSMMGVYYVLAGGFSWIPLLASIPVACFVTVVAYLKGARYELREHEGQQLVIKLNNTIIKSLFVLGYGVLVASVVAKMLPVYTLLALVSAPLAWSVVRTVEGNASEIHQYLWATVRSIAVLVLGGGLLALGLVLAR